MNSKILVIGLDGATLNLILPWVENGYLPTIAKLIQNGSYAKLNSIQPVISAGAWTTFMTGVNPGKHGVYDFIYRNPKSYDLLPITHKNVSVPTLWDILGEQGKRVGVINVPMTYPPKPVNGFMITGLGTPNYQEFTFPPELGKDILERGYQINRTVYQHHNNEENFLEDTYNITRKLTEITLYLMSNNPWDFLMVVYRDTDEVAHGFWHYMDSTHPDHNPSLAHKYKDVILNYYKTIDEEIGKLVEAVGDDTTIIIMSDHGFGPLYKDVYLNEWLALHGYLVRKTDTSLRKILGRLGITRNNIATVLRKSGLGRLEQIIKNILGEKISVLPQTSTDDLIAGVDWTQTKAYSFGYQGQIYVNLEGREPQGIVSVGEEYDELIKTLSADLKRWIDPEDNLPVVDQIFTKHDLYSGEFVEKAPDLVLVMRDLAYITRKGFELGSEQGKIFGKSQLHESGGHRLDGTLIACGPHIRKNATEQPDAWIGDLMPTILYLMGCKIPKHMDGTVLMNWLSPTMLKKPIFYEVDIKSNNADNVLSDVDKDELMNRLRDLGYLE